MGRKNRENPCDAYGENLVKATLPGGGWMYHHDGINQQLHKIFRQSGMVSDMEVEDFFLRKLRETAINPALSVPLLSKNLKGYVPDGHQTGVACGKYPAGVNQFTEVKVIHSGSVQYRRMEVRDDQQGAAAVNAFQKQVRGTYITNLREKDRQYFGSAETTRGPLESLVRRLDFKPLVFGTFGEMSSNVKEVIDMAVEYGVEHLGRSMAATTVDGVRIALRRRYRTQLSAAVWRGYANLILDRVKYVGSGRLGPNKAQVRAEMQERADEGSFDGVWMAHETDVPLRDAFPNGWEDGGEDALGRV
jgi:hypothetical protein